MPGQGAGGRTPGGFDRPGGMPDGRISGANRAVAGFLGGAAGSALGSSIADNRGDRVGDRTGNRSDRIDNRGERRDFASDTRQGRVENRGDMRSARVENRGDLRSNLADNRGERRGERREALGDLGDDIRDGIRDHYDHDHLFDNFWANNPGAHWRFHQNPVFWSWAAWNTVAAFMPWNWGAGAYYDYGSGGNVEYADDTVYVNDQPVPAEEYAAQAEALATNVPEPRQPDQMTWLPLGVFAMTADDSPKAVPNMFLQLAISNEGIIGGTYQNKSTEKIESVEGMVDRKSQRAAWTVVGKNTPIMETGIYNLTQNETRALVHFADGQTQQWLLVRIEGPTEGQ